MTKLASKLLTPPAPVVAAPPPETAALPSSLQETLTDPLHAAGLPDIFQKSAEDVVPQGVPAEGERVLRTTFLGATGMVPWSQIEDMMSLSTPIARDVQKAFQAQVNAATLVDPYVQLVMAGSDLAIRVQSQELIVCGPTVIVPGFAEAGEAKSAEAIAAGKDQAGALLGKIQDLSQDGDEAAASLEGEVRQAELESKSPDDQTITETVSNAADLEAGAVRVGRLQSTLDSLTAQANEVAQAVGSEDAREVRAVRSALDQAAARVRAASELVDRLRQAAQGQDDDASAQSEEEAKQAEPTPAAEGDAGGGAGGGGAGGGGGGGA